MKLKYDENVGVLLIEPDDPEDLIPLDAEDAEDYAEDLADISATREKYQQFGDAAPKMIYGEVLMELTPTVTTSGPKMIYGEGLIPRLKRSLGI